MLKVLENYKKDATTTIPMAWMKTVTAPEPQADKTQKELNPEPQ